MGMNLPKTPAPGWSFLSSPRSDYAVASPAPHLLHGKHLARGDWSRLDIRPSYADSRE